MNLVLFKFFSKNRDFSVRQFLVPETFTVYIAIGGFYIMKLKANGTIFRTWNIGEFDKMVAIY